MDISNKLKDPVVISIICGVIVFLYLWYNLDDDSDKKNKKKSHIEKIKEINLLIPIIASIIIWFITSCYFENSDDKSESPDISKNFKSQKFQNQNIQNQNPQYQLFQNTQPSATKTKYVSSNENLGYNLVNKKNIKLNRIELPDLFLEVDGIPDY